MASLIHVFDGMATDSRDSKPQQLPDPKVVVSGWIQDVGTKVTGLFQNGRVEDDAKDRCIQLAAAHELDAPWVTSLELYEKLEVAGNSIDRAPSTQYVLEQQPFIGWRNLGAQSLTKTFVYSPTETSAGAKKAGAATANHTNPPAEWSPLAGTDASVMLYIIRPPPPMVNAAATASLRARCSPSDRPQVTRRHHHALADRVGLRPTWRLAGKLGSLWGAHCRCSRPYVHLISVCG